MKILVVDDSKTVRLLVEKALRPFDCDVTGATNGFNALFAMERRLPDLILLDVNMPIMGGIELLTLMADNAQLRTIPVLMMTSPVDHAVSDQLKALGVIGTVMKPFADAFLVEKIRGVKNLTSRPSA